MKSWYFIYNSHMNLYEEIENWIKKQEAPFISERHLQDELWYHMRNILEIEDVVVEFPFKQEHTKGHSFLDIFAVVGKHRYGIEIKYQTKEEELKWYKGKTLLKKKEDAYIMLKNKGAEDRLRIASVMDIQRLEWLIKYDKIDKGIFLLVSNDERVWRGTKNDVVDKQFRFYDENQKVRTLNGPIKIKKEKQKNWNKNARNIKLKGSYKFHMKNLKENLFYTIVFL